MRSKKSGLQALLPVAAFAVAAMAAAAQEPAAAPDVALLVRHVDVTLGTDGVKRTTEFSEHFYRRGDTVWIERVLPSTSFARTVHQAREQPSDAHDHEHRHLNVATAARWITRGNDGKVALRLVSAPEAVVVDLTEVDWSNVGVDGSWSAASHLLDPALLARMQSVRTDGDMETFVRDGPGSRVTIVWNRSAQVPVRVETVDAAGTRETITEQVSMPAAMPWIATAAFNKKDYADYLD